MGFYRDYGPHFANLSLLATNRHNLPFSHSSVNQNSHNPRLSKTKYPVLRFTVLKILGIGRNNPRINSYWTGRLALLYVEKFRESLWALKTLIKNKITMHYD